MTRRDKEENATRSRRDFLSAALIVPTVGLSVLAGNSGERHRTGAGQSAKYDRELDSAESGIDGVEPGAGIVERGVDSAEVVSPDGAVVFRVDWQEGKRLRFGIWLNKQPVVDRSLMGIVVDGTDLGERVESGAVEKYRVREGYTGRGVHSRVENNCNGAKIWVTCGPSANGQTASEPTAHGQQVNKFLIDVRAFNDGIGFRYVVPGGEGKRVPDEATTFTFPAGSHAWYHDFEGHYEGVHTKKEIGDIGAGEWAALPMTVKLPGAIGYASITEAALIGYSGMGLQADGQRGFKARLAHDLPVSYPFRLRYGAEEGVRLAKAASITGPITSPWRVVMIGKELNALVNCDIVTNLSPLPDKTLFPNNYKTDWVKPGRAVWKYLDGGENTLEGMKEFSRLAGQLGFEYNIIEGFWEKWQQSELRELTDYSRKYNVGIWLWKHSRDLRTEEQRRNFFKICNDAGVVGAKIDFFDHEAKEIIDVYQVLLKEAAEAKILLDFHGANKPTGESRTWPNELSREAIKGMEARSMPTRAVHNTTLPFTRMLAGHADYTPVLFGERRRETSWAHQIATAAILSSDLLVYGAHPKSILENPAVEVIKNIPAVWDETKVLSISEIGEIAAFARRSGSTWLLAIMNGSTEKKVSVPLSFLGQQKFSATLIRDKPDDAAAVVIETAEVSRQGILEIAMRAGGGFIGQFTSK